MAGYLHLLTASSSIVCFHSQLRRLNDTRPSTNASTVSADFSIPGERTGKVIDTVFGVMHFGVFYHHLCGGLLVIPRLILVTNW